MARPKPFSTLREQIDRDPRRKRRVRDLIARLELVVNLAGRRQDPRLPPVEPEAGGRN